jgi:hypothetical protein
MYQPEEEIRESARCQVEMDPLGSLFYFRGLAEALGMEVRRPVTTVTYEWR